jgi:hypothetical protein
VVQINCLACCSARIIKLLNMLHCFNFQSALNTLELIDNSSFSITDKTVHLILKFHIQNQLDSLLKCQICVVY